MAIGMCYNVPMSKQNQRVTRITFNKLRDSYDVLTNIPGSRELSLAITKIEEAMMWLNKHRANKGYLGQLETHVSR